ncbi:LysB family transcriptional regulator [Gallibacterium anatis]|uniref:LysB family transcriptional regulator n=1 Tax=Gallibacterium anatis TaxID=750 RepID=UPI0030074F1B
MFIRLLKNHAVVFVFSLFYAATFILGVVDKQKQIAAIEKQKTAEIAKIKLEHQQQILMLQRQAEIYQQQQQLLIDKVTAMQQAAQQQEKAINEALESNKNWSDERVPSDVSRLLNNRNKAN